MTVHPAVTSALTWSAALAYPVLLNVVVLHTAEPTGLRLVVPTLLVVLVGPLFLRRPAIGFAVLLVASYTGTVSAASRIAALYAPGAEAGWEFGQIQAVVTDLAVVHVATTRRPRVAFACVVAALATQAAALAQCRTGAASFLSTLILLALTLALAWTYGHLRRVRNQHRAELRDRVTAEAVTAERLRIARELHDMVAHNIGAITIQAGVGRRVAGTRPEEAVRTLTAIESTGKDTLAGLRRMLVALRADDPENAPREPAPGLADLDRLVTATADAGVRVELERRGTPRTLPPDVELAAYRIVQEGVTNVVRHAGTDACRVVVDLGDDAVSVEITDEGPGLPARGGGGAGRDGGTRGNGAGGHGAGGHGAGRDGSGYGITGMRERTALLRGQFTAGPRPGGGFRVASRLPLPQEARPPRPQEAR